MKPETPTGPTTENAQIDLVAHLVRQQAFSLRTFGPGRRTAGNLAHIRKELKEIEACPHDLTEWIDVALLAFDGALRHGGTPLTIAKTLQAKLAENELRTWPDWRSAPEDEAITHIKDVAALPLDELSEVKFRVLQLESALAEAKRAKVSAEVDVKLAIRKSESRLRDALNTALIERDAYHSALANLLATAEPMDGIETLRGACASVRVSLGSLLADSPISDWLR